MKLVKSGAHLFRIVEAADKTGSVWEVVVIEEGTSLNGVDYPISVLEKAVDLFDGVKANAFEFVGKLYDHLPDDVKAMFPKGVVKNIVGWFTNPRIGKTSEGRRGVLAKLHISDSAQWLKDLLIDAWKGGQYKLLGLSIDARGQTVPVTLDDGQRVLRVEVLEEVDSVDIVNHPAAGGGFNRMVASVTRSLNGGQSMDFIKTLLRLVMAIDKDALEGVDQKTMTQTEAVSLLKKITAGFQADNFETKTAKGILDELVVMVEAEKFEDAAKSMNDLLEGKAFFREKEPDPDPGPEPEPDPTDDGKDLEALRKETAKIKADLATELEESRKARKLIESQSHLDVRLSESKLPDPIKAKLRKRFLGVPFEQKDLTEAIKDEEEVLDELTESIYPKGFGPTEVTSDERTLWSLAMDGLFEGEDQKDADGKVVPSFSGFKESFRVISGDQGEIRSEDMMIGLQWGFIPDFVRQNSHYDLRESAAYKGFKALRQIVLRESLKVSDWAEIMGDSVTRKMVKDYTASERIGKVMKIASDIVPVQDFRTQRRMRMGGYGVLSTVAEQGTYPSLTSPTDEEVTYALAKKGGLDDITMEMLTNDDVGSIRKIPVRLAGAASMALYRNVFDMFNGNSDQGSNNIGDDSSYGNTGDGTSADVVLADAGMNTAYKLMVKQTAYGDTYQTLEEANAPKILMVPAALRHIAHKIAKGDNIYQTGTVTAVVEYPATTPNPWQGVIDYIVIPYWDATSEAYWWAVADPKLQPTVELGFYKGKRTPEIFVQDQVNVGAAFTADKITYKVRFIYGYALIDPRCFYYAKFVA